MRFQLIYPLKNVRLKKKKKKNLKNQLTAKIYNINNNKEFKVIVIFKGKLKLTKGLLVYLVIIVVFYKVLNYFNFNFITYLLKDPKQLINRQVTKMIV